MTLPKKGSRKILCDDLAYRWFIRKKPTYMQAALQTEMTVAIEQIAAAPTQVLCVSVQIDRPDNWISPHQTAITPALIRAMIRSALAAGWNPMAQGSAFSMVFPVIRDQP